VYDNVNGRTGVWLDDARAHAGGDGVECERDKAAKNSPPTFLGFGNTFDTRFESSNLHVFRGFIHEAARRRHLPSTACSDERTASEIEIEFEIELGSEWACT
jgi:hypothetical protein